MVAKENAKEAVKKAKEGVKKAKDGVQKEIKKERKKIPFSELPEEKQQKIRDRQAKRVTDENRQETGGDMYQGEILVMHGSSYGWIQAADLAEFPEDVQAKIIAMTKGCKDKVVKAKIKANGDAESAADSCDVPVIYLRMSDLEEGVSLAQGDKVKFQIYVDDKGVGALNCTKV